MVNDFKRRKCSMRSKICIVPSTWCRPPPELAAPALLGRRPAGWGRGGGQERAGLDPPGRRALSCSLSRLLPASTTRRSKPRP
jgi:hypothetical protein